MKFLRSKLLYIASLGLLFSCSTDNTLELNLSPEILTLKPSGSDRSFVSSLGDTISLSLTRNDHFNEIESQEGSIGNLEFDQIRLEKRWYQTQSDNPFFLFNYNFSTSLSANDKQQIDALRLSFTDPNGQKSETLDIVFDGESFLLDPNLTIYYDSLTLVNKVFYEVFSPLMGNEDFKQFYYTAQQGVVGFVSGSNANLVFERIN